MPVSKSRCDGVLVVAWAVRSLHAAVESCKISVTCHQQSGRIVLKSSCARKETTLRCNELAITFSPAAPAL